MPIGDGWAPFAWVEAGWAVDAWAAVAVDEEAPTLTDPEGVPRTGSTADGSVVTNEAGGTLYWVVTTSATAPSVAQIQAGQDNLGVAAAASGSQAVAAIGTQNVSASGLTADTTYYWHFQQQDADSNDSDVVTSAAFATSPPPAVADLAATSRSNGRIALSWGAIAEATGGYRLYRGSTTGVTSGTGTLVVDTIALGYEDNGLTPGADYYYVVVAYNDVGDSDDSNEATAAAGAVAENQQATMRRPARRRFR